MDRFLWAAVFTLALLVFALSIYTYYLGNSRLACVNHPKPELSTHCLAFQEAIQQWGLSVDVYAGYLLLE